MLPPGLQGRTFLPGGCGSSQPPNSMCRPLLPASCAGQSPWLNSTTTTPALYLRTLVILDEGPPS